MNGDVLHDSLRIESAGTRMRGSQKARGEIRSVNPLSIETGKSADRTLLAIISISIRAPFVVQHSPRVLVHD